MKLYCEQCKKAFGTELQYGSSEKAVCPECKHEVAVPPEILSPGCVLGDFLLEKELSQGGMGRVFLARQISLDRPVALKVLHERFANNKEYVDGLFREARAAAKLTHPNIVQAYAVGEEDGIYYFAMEFIRGETFKQILKREHILKFEQAAKVVKEIAGALHAAWNEQKLVHQDIKPDNIMLDGNGFAKLSDLGLARNASSADKVNDEDTEVLGTPQYISPEQLTGIPTDVRSDIYSLGATFYHFVTGRFPYPGKDAEEMAKLHVEGNLKPPKEVNHDVPDALNTIICKMMARHLKDRYQSPDELIADLEKFLAHSVMPKVALNLKLPTATRPVNMVSPLKPAVPPTPAKPAVPPTPAKPAVPPTPAKPAVPPTPAKPAVPPTPAKPAVPPTPAKPAVPPTPAKPAVPPTPAEPAKAEETEKPEVPAKAEETEKPEVPEKAETSEEKEPEKKRKKFFSKKMLLILIPSVIVLFLVGGAVSFFFLGKAGKLPAALQKKAEPLLAKIEEQKQKLLAKMKPAAPKECAKAEKLMPSPPPPKPLPPPPPPKPRTRPELMREADRVLSNYRSNPSQGKEFLENADRFLDRYFYRNNRFHRPHTPREREALEHLTGSYALVDEELRVIPEREKRLAAFLKKAEERRKVLEEKRLAEEKRKAELVAQQDAARKQDAENEAEFQRQKKAAEEALKARQQQLFSQVAELSRKIAAGLMKAFQGEDEALKNALEEASVFKLPPECNTKPERDAVNELKAFQREVAAEAKRVQNFKDEIGKINENFNVSLRFKKEAINVISLLPLQYNSVTLQNQPVTMQELGGRNRGKIYNELRNKVTTVPAKSAVFYLDLIQNRMSETGSKEIPAGFWSKYYKKYAEPLLKKTGY